MLVIFVAVVLVLHFAGRSFEPQHVATHSNVSMLLTRGNQLPA